MGSTLEATRGEYHRKNVRVVVALLAVWFAVSILGIWLVRPLNTVTLFRFPLGYWLGSQGSLLTFIAEIFFYGKYMDGLDRRYASLGDRGRESRG
ncbi:MAG: DUF4212 domain-containing protein [Deltaproteobacteria bacterium]|nr:DUF4212 domain-containing protein [Deltaproteobacteria bacterium]